MTRPFQINWRPNRNKIVEHSPDCLVYLNGSPSIRGCGTCGKLRDFQKYITNISADASTEPNGAKANITLSIPKHDGTDYFNGADSVFRTGLEVNVYMRGYFPMQGLSSNEVQKTLALDLSDLPQYPYYPVFHGVVTNVDRDYSSGTFTVNISCASMLHFWSYVDISTNAQVIDARAPANSQLQTSLVGHNYTGMTPYAIMYDLYRNTTGAAAGVAFAIQGSTNRDASSSVAEGELYSMISRYWERRFQHRMYNLRMHGASGQLFTAAQQSLLSRLSEDDVQRILNLGYRSTSAEERNGRDPLRDTAIQLGFLRRDSFGRLAPALDVIQQEVADEDGNSFGVNTASFQAFIMDWGAVGVNLFESAYQSKMDIASAVSQVTGFEFYQDVDGDLVFKPPFYNLDTRPSRVYRIEPEDIISITFTDAEPEATYMIVKNPGVQNMAGTGQEGEWGVRSEYYDYRLIAQYGWRKGEAETSYYNTGRAAYYSAIAQLDVTNATVMNTCSITIPIRPEIRPGYPVYIAHEDCYYYVTALSHSFQFGGQCTTTLTCCAKRTLFHAPGRNNAQGISAIDLSNTILPPKTLQTRDGTRVGFPNVVMAIDPSAINPLYALRDVDFSNPTEDVLRVLVSRALHLGIIRPRPDSTPNEGPWILDAGEGEIVFTISDLPDSQVFQTLLSLATANMEGENELPNGGSTLAILQLLSDQKASFAPGVPGQYRYYSSSHPDPDQQGMREVIQDASGPRAGSLYQLFEPVSPPYGFQATRDPYVTISEDTSPSAGLNILRLFSRGGVVTPTHDITTVTFSKHSVQTRSRIPVLAEGFSFRNTSLTPSIVSYLTARFPELLDPNPEQPLADIYQQVAQALFSTPPAFTRTAPDDSTVSGVPIPFVSVTSSNNTLVKTAFGFPYRTLNDAIPKYGDSSAGTVLRLYAQSIANWMTAYYDLEMQRFMQTGNSLDYLSLVRDFERDQVAVAGKVISNPPPVQTFFETRETGRQYTTPVFPVSDENGYTVVGSYRYGRSLRIEPGGNLDQLTSLDPLRFASPEALDDYVNAMLRGSSRGTERAERALIESILSQPGEPGADQLLAYASAADKGTSDRTEMLVNGLRNFIASDRDSVFKIPVNNAARALANLAPLSQNTCACYLTDPNVLDLDQFVTLDTEVVTDFMQQEFTDAAPAWANRQNALRGKSTFTPDNASLRDIPRQDTFSGRVDAAVRDYQNRQRQVQEGVEGVNRSVSEFEQALRDFDASGEE